MSKKRKYDKEKIDVCRNCHGSGVVPIYQDGPLSTCPVCRGSGHIKKTVKIELTIEPYTGTDT